MFNRIVDFIVNSVFHMGYPGIVFLMALESSFFPFPSEVVIPPAGYLASVGKMNLYIVIFSGIVGSVLGALFNYYIAIAFGRGLLLRFGKFIFLDEKKFLKIEKFFNEHGEIATFIGRLLPGIRQYISFPAGLARMNLFKFVLYTALGAGIWVVILAYVGFFVGNNLELVKQNLHKITLVMLPIIIAIISIYAIYNKRRNN